MEGLTPGCGETAGLVVARGHQDALRVRLLQEVQHDLERLVVLQHFANLRSRVVDVAGVIDPAALNHEKEPLVAVLGRLLQRRQRRGRHLAQARIHIRHVPPVNLKRHIRRREQPQHRQADILPQPQLIKPGPITLIPPAVLLLRDPHDIHVIHPAAPLGPVRQEVTPPATQN